MRLAPVLLLLAFSANSWSLDFHVSPLGQDANPGDSSASFASLDRARDAIRDLKQQGSLPPEGVTVWVHAGAYPLSSSFILSAEDSGADEAPVVYRAVAGDEVRLIGGIAIPAEAFAGVSDAEVLERMDEAARDAARCADLRGLGINDFGQFPDRFEDAPAVSELFFNDARMELARWPNEGWAEIAKVVESGPAPWRNHESSGMGAFEYAGDRPGRWADAPDVWLQGYWCFDWSCDTIRVGSVDPAAKTITMAVNHVYGLGGGNPAPRRYYALNLLEELDQPGEYYIDRAAGRLYFWPPADLAQGRAALSTLKEPIIQLKEASNVTVQGFTIEACMGTAVHIEGGEGNRVIACRVRNTGRDGIVVTGGARHAVVSCDIHDTGMGGVLLSGGDRKTLTPCGHEAVNNDIFRVSRRMRTHAYNVHLGGVGVRIAHNLIHDAPHQAIGLGGNDHVIEFNKVYDVGIDSDDCGAFYMGRNPSERGSIIRYNSWSRIGSAMAHGSCAVYFDDGAGGQTVFGNVFHRACGGNFGAVFVHGGHGNTVDNNIFIECKKAIGAVPWDASRWREWLDGDLWRTRLLTEVDITRPPYTDRYPDLNGFMESDKTERLNHATRNVAYDCDTLIDGNWDEKDNLVTDTDPGFVDAAAGNFLLRDDSEVFQKVPGFEPIPFGKIGISNDEFRKTGP